MTISEREVRFSSFWIKISVKISWHCFINLVRDCGLVKWDGIKMGSFTTIYKEFHKYWSTLLWDFRIQRTPNSLVFLIVAWGTTCEETRKTVQNISSASPLLSWPTNTTNIENQTHGKWVNFSSTNYHLNKNFLKNILQGRDYKTSYFFLGIVLNGVHSRGHHFKHLSYMILSQSSLTVCE